MISKENQQKVFDYIDTQLDRYIEELSELIRHRSMSVEGTGMLEGAEAVAALVRKSGFEADVHVQETGFPIVLGQTGDKKEKRYGVYGHYDVFPEGDKSQWICDPYDPKVIDGKLYGRASTDDKGNLFINIKAAEAIKNVLGELPVDLAFLFEGEEEIGSKSLRGFLDQHMDHFGKLGGFIASDRGWHESGRPCIYLGSKSNVTFKLTLRYGERNFHSGHAPLIPNPAWDLLHVLAKIRDADGNILIPALKGKKIEPTDADVKLLNTIPFDIEEYKATYGIDRILNEESGFAAARQLVFDASCNINNFVAGTEEANGIVPGYATATVDMRLSGDYNPYEICDSLVEYVKSLNPQIEITTFVTHGYRASAENEFVKNILEAAEQTTGDQPVTWPSWDGSGPLGILHRTFDIPALIIGLGAPFTQAHTHSINEYIGLDNIIKGVKMMAGIYMTALDKE